MRQHKVVFLHDASENELNVKLNKTKLSRCRYLQQQSELHPSMFLFMTSWEEHLVFPFIAGQVPPPGSTREVTSCLGGEAASGTGEHTSLGFPIMHPDPVAGRP